MNVMTVDKFHAVFEFDPDLDLFRGQILGLNGGADFCHEEGRWAEGGAVRRMSTRRAGLGVAIVNVSSMAATIGGNLAHAP